MPIGFSTIRPSRDDEMTTLLDMRHAMTLELDGEDLDTSTPGWRERFSAYINEMRAKNEAIFFIAERDRNIAGMGGVYKLRNHRSVIYGGTAAYVTSVYVAPHHRRLGIAREITQAAVAWARAHNCVVVRLRASKTGRLVYETLGFRQTDEMELRIDS